MFPPPCHPWEAKVLQHIEKIKRPGGLKCCLKHRQSLEKVLVTGSRLSNAFVGSSLQNVTNPGNLELLQSGVVCSQVCVSTAVMSRAFKPPLHGEYLIKHWGYLINHWGLFSSFCSKWCIACFQVTLLLFWDSVLPFRSDWPGSSSVAQAGLELTAILLGLQACVAMQVGFWTLIFFVLLFTVVTSGD